MTQPSETRFGDAKSEEYRLIGQFLPHFEALQGWVGRLCAQHCSGRSGPLTALDIGCGDGVTSENILKAVPALHVVAIDPEPKMIDQAAHRLRDFVEAGRCRIVAADALGYLQGARDGMFEIVASALTLHNLQAGYRRDVHRHIWRALQAGGMFVNADKYSPQDDQARFAALAVALTRFFDALMRLEKYSLLKEWVLHAVADQAPYRCMRQDDAARELAEIGFVDITFHDRENLEAVLSARKAV